MRSTIITIAILAVIALVIAMNFMIYSECRAHGFSVFYCIVGRR